MDSYSQGEAHLEPTEETTVRVYIEQADGESNVYFLEPGNTLALAEDGPIMLEAHALTENERAQET